MNSKNEILEKYSLLHIGNTFIVTNKKLNKDMKPINHAFKTSYEVYRLSVSGKRCYYTEQQLKNLVK